MPNVWLILFCFVRLISIALPASGLASSGSSPGFHMDLESGGQAREKKQFRSTDLNPLARQGAARRLGAARTLHVAHEKSRSLPVPVGQANRNRLRGQSPVSGAVPGLEEELRHEVDLEKHAAGPGLRRGTMGVQSDFDFRRALGSALLRSRRRAEPGDATANEEEATEDAAAEEEAKKEESETEAEAGKEESEEPGANQEETKEAEEGKEAEEADEEETKEEEEAKEEAKEEEEKEEQKEEETKKEETEEKAEKKTEEKEEKKTEQKEKKKEEETSDAEELKEAKEETEELEDKVADELKSKSVAEILGDIKMDVFRLNQKVEDLAEDVHNGVKIDDGREPLVYPLSTTMYCIINLTIQYFLVYTATALVRTFEAVMDLPPSDILHTLKVACDTVAYAPMLCVLFLGTRMRALQITQGKGAPQIWVQDAMQMCTWAVLVQTLLVLAIPLFTGASVQCDEDGNVEQPKIENPAIAGILTLTRYMAMLSQYLGFTLVCIGVFTMDAKTLKAEPVDMWDDPDTPELELAPVVSPAVACTMNLTIQYFVVYLMMAIVRTLSQFKPSERILKWIAVLEIAKVTVNMAPMLCILFVGARMRALQLDPMHGNPQRWAQLCFYMCAYSVLVQTLMVFMMPLVGGDVRVDKETADVKFEMRPGAMRYVTMAVRYAALLCLYGGFTAVIVSVIIIEAPDGKPTPPVSPAMLCVMNLTIQYFFVTLMLFLTQTYSEIRKQALPLVTKTLESAEATVKFCPMLAVLFVGTRMRALQLSQQRGSPQCWAQDGMFLASYSVLVQLIMCLLLGVVYRDKMQMDEDGNPVVVVTNQNPFVHICIEVVRYAAFVCLYGGVITVVVSVLMITPQTANCEERNRLVPLWLR